MSTFGLSRLSPARIDHNLMIGYRSKVRGTVKRMDCGNIRWSLLSSFEGIDRWSSEGVQIGGQQSGQGVHGIWTGCDHEIEDPAGPFILWRTMDPDVETPDSIN